MVWHTILRHVYTGTVSLTLIYERKACLKVSYSDINLSRTKLDPSHLKTLYRTVNTVCLGYKNIILYTEIIAVCYEILKKHVNTLWAEYRISEC